MGKYLVTGAAGFIGRSIAAALLDRGNQVRGIDNFITGRRANLVGLEAMEFREGDLTHQTVCTDACVGVDTIFHEAALASVPRSIKDPIETNENCVTTTVNLLNAARAAGVRRFIYAGSSSAYGDNPILPKREDMPPDPISPYAVAKLAGEQYVRCFARVYGLESVVLRYFNVFGPYQDPLSEYSGVLAIFCQKMLSGEPIVIYGDGDQSRDFTFIDNVVHANLLASSADARQISGAVLNIGTGIRVSLNETFRVLQSLTRYQIPATYAEPRKGDLRDSQADIGLARTMLGYEPIVSFEEGLKQTVEWYQRPHSREPIHKGCLSLPPKNVSASELL